MTTDRQRAREYRRLSDRKGGTSIKDQGVDNEAAAEEQDWELGEPYIDEVSASRYARKKRDDFDQLVADLGSGPTGRESDFGADVLMLWESSRGSRRVGEWATFIDLLEDKGVKIWVTTHERLYDPGNGRDRKTLLEDAVDSEYESYKTHKRVSRTAPKEARRGRPHGKAPTGLKPVYDPDTGTLVTWVEDEEWSEPVKLLFEMLAAGHSMAAVEQRLEELGHRNKAGHRYTHGQLRGMAVRHSYAGLRCYKGTVYKGVWDGLVEEEVFWAVHDRMVDPSRVTSRGGVQHELTSSLWCGSCEVNLSPRYISGRKPNYRCASCGRKIQKDPVDELIIGHRDEPGVLMEFLSRPDIYDVLREPTTDAAAVREIRAQLARARAERDEMREATGTTLAEVRLLANSLHAKDAEVIQLEARERELTVPSAVLTIVQPGVDVWVSWSQAPVTARRETARLILAPRYLGRPCILPSPRAGWHQEIAERIEWRRTPSPSPPAYRR
ncbi:recombinase family protein [Streptomyces sp. NY05-11A]|uniref:recombinase family protein n=1 Tax=Streptomyces soliscabiei TaxID=588897 RepID=UPI0029A4D1F5|nr:recombinase family protein [Streptomyces sp. NY05-11A]MDX2681064.1 recombinase family protein [Streptomyces sp. NY05-11A]